MVYNHSGKKGSTRQRSHMNIEGIAILYSQKSAYDVECNMKYALYLVCRNRVIRLTWRLE